MANPRQPQQDHFGDTGVGIVLGQRHATDGDLLVAGQLHNAPFDHPHLGPRLTHRCRDITRHGDITDDRRVGVEMGRGNERFRGVAGGDDHIALVQGGQIAADANSFGSTSDKRMGTANQLALLVLSVES